MSVRISKSDIVWNYLGNIMTLGVNIFLLPIILRCLSKEELGLWYTFAAVGNLAVLFDFGFKATMGRSITYAWCGAKELRKYDTKPIEKGLGPNFVLMSKTMQVTRIIYLFISFVALGVLGSIGTLYVRAVSKNLSFNDILIPWVLYIVGVFLNLYYGYFNSFLSAVGAIKQVNVATVVSRGTQLIMSLLLLITGHGILSMSLSYCVYSMVFRVMASRAFFNYDGIGTKLKKIKDRLTKQEFIEFFNIIWHSAWRDGLVAVTLFLNGQATTLLCSAFLSLEDTAVYGLSMQLVNAIASISSIYFSTYQSQMQGLYIQRNENKLRRRFSSTIFIYAIVYLFGALMVCLVGVRFLDLIKSNTNIDIALLIVLFLYTFLYKNHTLCASYLAGTNRVIYTKAYVLSSVIMIGLTSLALYFKLAGVWALAISPLLVETFYNNWYWPRFVYKELKLTVPSIFNLGLKQVLEDVG